jgi:hypothetical protein
MNNKAFNALKVGDKVTLAVDNESYFVQQIIPAKTQGIVGAVKVPAIRGKQGKYFVCIDFPLLRKDTDTFTHRVGAFKEELV